MLQTGLRATFIRSDGGEEQQVSGVRMSYLDDAETMPKLIVAEDDVPDWVGRGAEVVVADENSNVEAAFEIGFIGYVDLEHVGGSGWPSDESGLAITFSPSS